MNAASANCDADLVRPSGTAWLKLALSVFAVGAIWLIALPWLASLPTVEQHIAEQERQGIDPAAVFYSELEILPPIAHRYERLHDTHGDQLWGR